MNRGSWQTSCEEVVRKLKKKITDETKNTAMAELPCSIFDNVQKYSKLYLNFSWFFSILSKNRKIHDLKIAYGVKG